MTKENHLKETVDVLRGEAEAKDAHIIALLEERSRDKEYICNLRDAIEVLLAVYENRP